jgi:hypothetical protein
MSKDAVLIAGLGDLGGYVLEFLARVPNIPRIVTADYNEDWGARKTNSAIIGAAQLGLYPKIEFIHLDAFDIDRTANVLQEIQPTVIFNAMALLPWQSIYALPEKAFKAIDEAGFVAPWYPLHFVPIYKLMQAVKKSGIRTHVVNSAVPDIVNPALARIGLGPTVGSGNIDTLQHVLRLVAAKMFAIPLRAVTLYLVAPVNFGYHVSRFGNDGGISYYFKIIIDHKDLTQTIDRKKFLANVLKIGRRPVGMQGYPISAASACKIIMGILFDTKELCHAPGPDGLPGGYPVKLSANGVDISLPDDITIEEAMRINKEGQTLDGVESIEDNGSVVVTDKVTSILKRLLDFDCKVYSIQDCETKAEELREKFGKWRSQFK